MPQHPEKARAIALRKAGLSYSEILNKIPVAKSTLSLWLRAVGLAVQQRQRLTEKKLAAMRRGSLLVRQRRIEGTARIKALASEEIGTISKRELLLIGTALYWAEGSKAKEHNTSQGVIFSNSDPWMIKLFLHWLKKAAHIQDDDIFFEVYIHKNSSNSVKVVVKYWADILKVEPHKLSRIYFKVGNPRSKRRNVGDGYFGLMRVRVKRSTNLNRSIAGWVEGIYKHCGVV